MELGESRGGCQRLVGLGELESVGAFKSCWPAGPAVRAAAGVCSVRADCTSSGAVSVLHGSTSGKSGGKGGCLRLYDWAAAGSLEGGVWVCIIFSHQLRNWGSRGWAAWRVRGSTCNIPVYVVVGGATMPCLCRHKGHCRWWIYILCWAGQLGRGWGHHFRCWLAHA